MYRPRSSKSASTDAQGHVLSVGGTRATDLGQRAQLLLKRRPPLALGQVANSDWTASSSTAGLPTTILAGRPG